MKPHNHDNIDSMKMAEKILGEWKPQPKAEAFLSQVMEKAYDKCQKAYEFKNLLRESIAVRMRDLLDHITFNDKNLIPQLRAHGWISQNKDNLFTNSSGIFPDFVFAPGTQKVGFKVEFVDDFVLANQLNTIIIGKHGDQYRETKAFTGNGTEFWAVERHGTNAFEPLNNSDDLISKAQIMFQSFRARRREFNTVKEGFDHLEDMVDAAIARIGVHWSCDLFLRAEREYWMQRNTSGRMQKERQDQWGIGWANQDHHTFDSSRQHFYRTILILEKLGFECRELFYAGAGAGWGSQILEQPILRSIIFADIDLLPEELDIDFAHNQEIRALHPYRRAGLWCAMHGESMLQAGLNHLECMYDSNKLNEQFSKLGIEMMNPFSDLPQLYQALTVGEWWPVDPKKIDALERDGHIDKKMAQKFRLNGAIGSHFENLERNDGFKGFNQPGIDDVLRIIDPRKQCI